MQVGSSSLKGHGNNPYNFNFAKETCNDHKNKN